MVGRIPIFRPRKTGDRLTLPDGRCVTLKKLFLDRRLPQPVRDRVPVLELDGQVIAVAGFGADPRWTARDGEQAVILRKEKEFFSDMIRATPIQCQIDFMAVSSYGGGTSTSGKVRMLKDVSVDLRGRHVVILEDILDSGVTLSHVCAHLREMGPASLKICTLLDKPSRRQTDVKADYVGFTIPNEFVVGYGLDYDEHYRNLPYVGILKPEVYTK